MGQRRHTDETKLKISKSISEYLKNHPEHGGLHYWKGRKMSESTKSKMRESSKKSMNSGRWKKGQEPWNKDFIGCYTLKDIHKVDCACSFCKSSRGELRGRNHPNWITDRSLMDYPEMWTKELKIFIRLRDNYTCQICKKRGLSVHHIDYDKMNLELTNLITLCQSCHMKTNFNREQWLLYFKKYEKK